MAATYYGYRLAQWLSLRLRARTAFRCAQALADTWCRISPGDRAAVQANLSMVVGTPVAGDDPMVREVFRNFGRYLVEFFNSHRADRSQIQAQGIEHLQEALRHRVGAIIVTGHLGNWELGAVVLRRMGWPVSVVALPHEDPRMDRLFNRQRRRCRVEVIPVGAGAARRSLQRLREGRLLGLVGDREFSHNGLRLPTCGHQLILPRGPATLSLRSRAPILPTFLIREGPGAFRLFVEAPLWPPPRAHDEEAVRAVTQAYLAVFERYLKRFPDQWLMFQPAAQPQDGDLRTAPREATASAAHEVVG